MAVIKRAFAAFPKMVCAEGSIKLRDHRGTQQTWHEAERELGNAIFRRTVFRPSKNAKAA
jgi:hypothetical protein